VQRPPAEPPSLCATAACCSPPFVAAPGQAVSTAPRGTSVVLVAATPSGAVSFWTWIISVTAPEDSYPLRLWPRAGGVHSHPRWLSYPSCGQRHIRPPVLCHSGLVPQHQISATKEGPQIRAHTAAVPRGHKVKLSQVKLSQGKLSQVRIVLNIGQ